MFTDLTLNWLQRQTNNEAFKSFLFLGKTMILITNSTSSVSHPVLPINSLLFIYKFVINTKFGLR